MRRLRAVDTPETPEPYAGAMPTTSVQPDADPLVTWLPAYAVVDVLWGLAWFLIGCLILWFIIYLAVRSALRSHHQWVTEEERYKRGVSRTQRLNPRDGGSW
jgi:hypothetical protein